MQPHSWKHPRLPAALLAAVLLLARAWCAAQEPAPSALPLDETGTSTAELEAERRVIAEAEGLDEAVRARALALYDDALKQLMLAEEWRQKAAQFEQMRQEAPQLAAQYQEELAAPPADIPEPPAGAPLADLELLLGDVESQYRDAQAQFDQLTAEPQRRADRRREVPNALAGARQRLHEAQARLVEPAAAGDTPEMALGRRALVQARIAAIKAEISAHERELQAYDARSAVLTLRQEVAQRQLAQIERRLRLLREVVAVARRAEAEQAAQAAQRVLEETIGLVDDAALQAQARAIAEKNAELAAMRTGAESLAPRIEEAEAELETLKRERDRLEEEHDRVMDRVRAVGFGRTVGLLLRNLKESLPGARQIDRRIAQHNARIAEIEAEQGKLRAQRLELAGIEQQLEDNLARLQADMTEHEIRRIRAALRELLQDRRNLLDALAADYNTLLNLSFETTAELIQVKAQAASLTDYINRHILWTGGYDPLGWNTLANAADALYWIVDTEARDEMVLLLLLDGYQRLPLYVLALAAFLLWLVAGQRVGRQLASAGQTAARPYHTRFRDTFEALWRTAFLAAGWPALLAGVAWRINEAAAVPQARAIAQGLLAVASALLILEFTRHALRPKGLIDAHFDLGGSWLRAAQRLVALVALAALPAVFLVFALEAQQEESWKEAAGRLAFVALMLVYAVAAWRTLHLVLAAFAENKRESIITGRPPARWLLRALLCGLPLALAVLALAGYYYTALRLQQRFYGTVALWSLIALGSALVRRWLLLTRRRLVIEQARRKREAAASDKEKTAEKDKTATEEETAHALDLVRIDTQTQKLLRAAAVFGLIAGTFLIWRDVIPALNALDRFKIWSITVTVQDAAGENGVLVSHEEIQDITAANFLYAAIIIVVTTVSVRNLPGLLEILFLQKMRAGERYATLAIVRYILIAVGTVAAFNSIGVGWSKVQWLVAALGVGLGFGLQEIFANFVSGIVLFFERPIRVGDTVTVGSLSGTVSQIRMRATTITDWDRKELIVPNKEFITGQLINWSLSDTILRLTLPVGIAYGSDTERARDELLRVAHEHPDLVADPAPQAFFLGFGESSLDFELRAFSPDVSSFVRIKHELYMAIDKAFREAGIEIAFPQRDLHVRSGLDGLAQAIRERDARPGPPQVME